MDETKKYKKTPRGPDATKTEVQKNQNFKLFWRVCKSS